MIILVGLALAGEPSALLLCDRGEECGEEARWVALVAPDVALRTVADLAVVGSGSGTSITAAIDEAREAAEREQWRGVAAPAGRAVAGIEGARGSVDAESLFLSWFLLGAADLARERPDAAALNFRQAAALSEGADPPPFVEASVRTRYLEEVRMLVTAGRGTLNLPPDEGIRWEVDGREARPGATLNLLSGTHRVTAERADAWRGWAAMVPVLPGRTTTVGATFAELDDAAWLAARMDDALALHTLEPAVADLLVRACAAWGIDELGIFQVVGRLGAPPVLDLTLSASDPLRPAAAAGLPLVSGDAIPATYEAQVADAFAAAGEAHPSDVRTLAAVWFDPLTRTLSASPRHTVAIVEPERVQVGVRVGFTGIGAGPHGALDLLGAGRIGGAWHWDARVGVVRGPASYNLYAEWVDRQLYHLLVGARWSPDRPIAPFVGAAAEVYVPYTQGARVSGGVTALVAPRLHLEGEAWAGWLVAGVSYGAGVSMTRGF